MKEQYLRTEEAAELAGKTARAMVCLRNRGVGPQAYRIGRCVRYKRSEVIAWLEAHPILLEQPKAGAK